MAERGEVEPDLVGATGDRCDLEPCAVGDASVHPPAGLGGAAGLGIDAIPRWPRRIAGDRQVDHAFVGLRLATHETLVSFAYCSCLKLSAEVPLGSGVERHQHQARGVAVEPVDNDRGWKSRLHPAGEAVL